MGEDWNKEFNYCEEGFSHAEWFNRAFNEIAYRMFKTQLDWVWMAGEKAPDPVVKSAEDFDRAFEAAWNEVTWLLRAECRYGLLEVYRANGMTLGEELDDELGEWLPCDSE